jgi:hypothetical protein
MKKQVRNLGVTILMIMPIITLAADPNSIPAVKIAPVAKLPIATQSAIQQATTKTLPAKVTQLCPDPAAQRIDISRASTANRRVTITGVMRNLGGGYETRPNQQQITLYETRAGVPGGRVVASAPFGNLTPGQEVRVNYSVIWNSGQEFPPSYKLMISYDPDILIDANTRNDDCRNNNNEVTRNGEDINRLFN